MNSNLGINPSKTKFLNGSELKVAIILSRFNQQVGRELQENTVEHLKKLGVKQNNIEVFEVPGALEMPLLAQKISTKKKHNVIIALGIVIKGETLHFEIVSHESHRALMDLSIKKNLPIIFGILCTRTLKQAKDRVSKSKLNKGKEFAEAAVEMGNLFM